MTIFRDSIINKLKDDLNRAIANKWLSLGSLTIKQAKQVIADLEYVQFAEEQLKHIARIEEKPALLKRKGDKQP